jgi:uncharacterized membrane protein
MNSDFISQRLWAQVSSRKILTLALYALFVCGGLCNAWNGYQSFTKAVTPIIFVALGCGAFYLMYGVTIRNVGVALVVLLMIFASLASGAGFGFPFGDYAFTNALGPKLLDVPLVIPFFWLAVLIASWCAADRMLRYKHVVVAAIVVTAFDAVLEFAADSLDLWHWQGGMPTELNFISWLAISYLGLSVLKRYAIEKQADPIVHHLLIVQLLYFFITDVGIRLFSPQP